MKKQVVRERIVSVGAPYKPGQAFYLTALRFKKVADLLGIPRAEIVQELVADLEPKLALLANRQDVKEIKFKAEIEVYTSNGKVLKY